MHTFDVVEWNGDVWAAGVVMWETLVGGRLFTADNAVETLSRTAPFAGNRVGLITNGGGPGAMAADRAGDLGIPLAQLSNETMAALNKTLPTNWSHSNPIDIAGDATPEHQPGFDGPRAQILETPDTLRVVLDPTVPFLSQATVAS